MDGPLQNDNEYYLRDALRISEIERSCVLSHRVNGPSQNDNEYYLRDDLRISEFERSCVLLISSCEWAFNHPTSSEGLNSVPASPGE